MPLSIGSSDACQILIRSFAIRPKFGPENLAEQLTKPQRYPRLAIKKGLDDMTRHLAFMVVALSMGLTRNHRAGIR
jgi:hypothetical protein